MGQVVRAPLYVPKAPEEALWIGAPKATAIVLLAALAPTFFLHPTRAITPYQDTFWQGSPEPIPSVLLQLPAQPPFSAKGTRHFDLVVPEPVWTGTPRPVPLSIKLPSIALPFFNPRQFNYAQEHPSFLSIPFALAVKAQDVLAFRNVRNFDYVPEPGWTGRAQPPSLSLLLPPSIALPFFNYRYQGPIAAPDWVKGGGSIPLVQLQLPAQPPFTIRPTQRFDHVPEPVWLGKPVPVSLIYTIPPTVVLPFANHRLFDNVPEPVWYGKPVPYPLNFVLAPTLALAFSNLHQFNFVADPQPSQPSRPIPSALLQLPAQPPFTAKGTRIFNVPNDVPWSMHGKGSAIIFLPVSISGAVQVLKNVVVRTRVLSNTTTRVRVLKNTITRGNS